MKFVEPGTIKTELSQISWTTWSLDVLRNVTIPSTVMYKYKIARFLAILVALFDYYAAINNLIFLVRNVLN